MRVRYHAQWVLPITSPPLRHGWIEVANGRIVAVGRNRPAREPGVEEIELGRVAVLPGLVNAHTHLELSWLWGKVPPAASLPTWVGGLMALRAAHGDDPTLIRQAIIDALEAGTAAVGDVSNTLAPVAVLSESPLQAVVFHEIIGFNPSDPAAVLTAARAAIDARTVPGHIQLRLAPHAPYSASPALIEGLAREARARHETTTIHLGESPEEVVFLQTGGGPWRDLLQRRGVWPEAWRVPGCSPVQYLERLGVLSERLLVVHAVQVGDDDLALLAARGATVVTCPRSNVWVGVGRPPIERFYASGVRLAVGTDSLASTPDLNVFSELALMHDAAPAVPPAWLLDSATRQGARALGFDDLGVLAPGARARLIAIDLPLDVRDVEAYLVEGIEPTQVAWVPPATGPFAPTL